MLKRSIHQQNYIIPYTRKGEIYIIERDIKQKRAANKKLRSPLC